MDPVIPIGCMFVDGKFLTITATYFFGLNGNPAALAGVSGQPYFFNYLAFKSCSALFLNKTSAGLLATYSPTVSALSLPNSPMTYTSLICGTTTLCYHYKPLAP